VSESGERTLSREEKLKRRGKGGNYKREPGDRLKEKQTNKKGWEEKKKEEGR